MQELVALITQEQKLFTSCVSTSLWNDQYSSTDVTQLSFFVESIEITGEPDAEMRKGGPRLEHA